MAEPRFRQYTNLSRNKKEKKSVSFVAMFKKGLILVISLALIFVAGWVLIRIVPRVNSTHGKYTPPQSRGQIEPFSQARWILNDTHSEILKVCLAWCHNATLSPAADVSRLDESGLRPFLFCDEKAGLVNIYASMDETSEITDDFFFVFVAPEGVAGGFNSIRTLKQTNLAGQESLKQSLEIVSVNPEDITSIHGQFLSQDPEFQEVYACFLAHVWETAASGFVTLYQRPPENLAGLLDGIGVVPNPDCAWPFEPRERIGVNVEGGLIDGKIVYWQVTMLNGQKYGQARYWDQYTSYDDPDTPVNIITRDNNSPVVRPDEIQGARQVLFTWDTVKNLLDEARSGESQPED